MVISDACVFTVIRNNQYFLYVQNSNSIINTMYPRQFTNEYVFHENQRLHTGNQFHGLIFERDLSRSIYIVQVTKTVWFSASLN